MKSILILVIGLLFIIPFTSYAYAQSPGGGVLEDTVPFTFHTESDDNANLSYAPGMGNLSNLNPDDFVVGQAHEVRNTIASITEELSPKLPEISPIKDYKTNSSDWNIMTDTNPDLNQSFVTDFSKQDYSKTPNPSQQNQTVAAAAAIDDNKAITADNNISDNVNDIKDKLVSVFPANFTKAMGTIASIQNNESGEPTWILSGSWELLIPKPLKINQTNPPDAAPFSATFEMMKKDGTVRHTHTVSNFNLQGSEANGNVLVLTGTATVLMPEGLVEEVPVSLTISNQDALKLWIYPWIPMPEPKDYHFGKNPIYGVVSLIGTFFTYP
ncbi:MAG: hypothetical protein L0H53_12890 [Candidatus Nitrosocosmicus sp.]|nr:hypothetical protein [Candidatus Nitrosocosmicus sp.]MDN5868974.1 hypothetical protein [Candidatus Nitrosocosmicus sp.]